MYKSFLFAEISDNLNLNHTSAHSTTHQAPTLPTAHLTLMLQKIPPLPPSRHWQWRIHGASALEGLPRRRGGGGGGVSGGGNWAEVMKKGEADATNNGSPPPMIGIGGGTSMGHQRWKGFRVGGAVAAEGCRVAATGQR